MNTIEVKIENGEKLINNQNLDLILQGLDNKSTDINELKDIFEKINSEEELVAELKKISQLKTPVTLLKYILYIGNLSVSEANPILYKVLNED